MIYNGWAMAPGVRPQWQTSYESAIEAKLLERYEEWCRPFGNRSIGNPEMTYTGKLGAPQNGKRNHPEAGTSPSGNRRHLTT